MSSKEIQSGAAQPMQTTKKDPNHHEDEFQDKNISYGRHPEGSQTTYSKSGPFVLGNESAQASNLSYHKRNKSDPISDNFANTLKTKAETHEEFLRKPTATGMSENKAFPISFQNFLSGKRPSDYRPKMPYEVVKRGAQSFQANLEPEEKEKAPGEHLGVKYGREPSAYLPASHFPVKEEPREESSNHTEEAKPLTNVVHETPSFSNIKFESYHDRSLQESTPPSAYNLQSAARPHHWQAHEAYLKQESSLNISEIQTAEKTPNKSNISHSASLFEPNASLQSSLNLHEKRVYQAHDLGPSNLNFSGPFFEAGRYPEQTQSSQFMYRSLPHKQQQLPNPVPRSQSQKYLQPHFESQAPSSLNLSHFSALGAVSRSTRESYNTTFAKNLQESIYTPQAKAEEQQSSTHKDKSPSAYHKSFPQRLFRSRARSHSKLLHRKRKSFAEDLPGFLASQGPSRFRNLSDKHYNNENNGDSRASSDDEASNPLKPARRDLQSLESRQSSQQNIEVLGKKVAPFPKSNHGRSLSFPEKLLAENRTLSSNNASRTNLLNVPETQQKLSMSNLFSHTKVSRYGPSSYLELRKSYQQDQKSTDGNESFSHSLPRTASQSEGILNLSLSQNFAQEIPSIFIIPARKSDPKPPLKPPLISRKDSSLLKSEPLEAALLRNSYEKEKIELSNITQKKLDFTLEEEDEEQGGSSENVQPQPQEQRKSLPQTISKEPSSGNARPEQLLHSDQRFGRESIGGHMDNLRESTNNLSGSLRSMQDFQLQFYNNDSNLYGESKHRLITDPIENYRFTAQDEEESDDEGELRGDNALKIENQEEAYNFERHLLARMGTNKDPYYPSQLHAHPELKHQIQESVPNQNLGLSKYMNRENAFEAKQKVEAQPISEEYEVVHIPTPEQEKILRLTSSEPASRKLTSPNKHQQLSPSKFEVQLAPEGPGYEKELTILKAQADSHIQRFFDSKIQQQKEQEEHRMKMKKDILNQLLRQEKAAAEMPPHQTLESRTKTPLQPEKQWQQCEPSESIEKPAESNFPVVRGRHSQLFTKNFEPVSQTSEISGHSFVHRQEVSDLQQSQSYNKDSILYLNQGIKQRKKEEIDSSQSHPPYLDYSLQQTAGSIRDDYLRSANQAENWKMFSSDKTTPLEYKSLKTPPTALEGDPWKFRSEGRGRYPLDTPFSHQERITVASIGREGSSINRSIEGPEEMKLSKSASKPTESKLQVLNKPLMNLVQKKLIAYKPSNKHLIKNAIVNVCLPFEPNRKERELIFAKIDEVKADNFIILFADVSSRQDFGGLYSFDSSTGAVKCIYSTTLVPTILTPNMVHSFYRYESGLRAFKEIPGNKNFSIAVDAIALLPSILKQYTKTNFK